MSSKAVRDLMNYPSTHTHIHKHIRVRAYFSSKCKSWDVDNNMVESFNLWILDPRYMLIRTKMEFIRRINNKHVRH